MTRRLDKNNLIFYALTGIVIVFIFISNPFLNPSYDPWKHLNWIVELSDSYAERTIPMSFWHLIWAKIFKITGISDIFVRAKIIHVFQFLLAFTAVFYFCKTVIKILLEDIETIHLRYLSFLGVLIWFIGNGTFSIAYQQAWIIWYSVTYQGLAIPLFWYIVALTLKITYEGLPLKRALFYLMQIAIISVVIAKVHPMELLYFLIHLSVLFLVNPKKLFTLLKRYYYVAIPVILSVTIAIKYFTNELIPSYILPTSMGNSRIIWQKIIGAGSQVVDGKLNRYPNSFSEIAIVSILLAMIFRTFYYFFYLYKKDNKIPVRKLGWGFLSNGVNIKGFDYILAASLLFYVIPLNRITAGIGSYLLTIPDVVWRFFFGSPWFIILPVLIYISFKYFSEKQSLAKVMLTNAVVIFVLIVLSKYILWGALYKNTESIIVSLDKSRGGVQYSGHK